MNVDCFLASNFVLYFFLRASQHTAVIGQCGGGGGVALFVQCKYSKFIPVVLFCLYLL